MVNRGLSDKSKNLILKKLFYFGLIILPVMQFAIFYIFVNFNSFLLAFQEFDLWGETATFAGLKNFSTVFDELFTKKIFNKIFANSLIASGANLLVGIPLAVLFSHYIYRKGALAGLFKTILYIPHVVSSVSLVIIYKYFVELGIPFVIQSMNGGELIAGLYSNPDTSFATVLFFNLWVGFGPQVLMYSSSMSSINESLLEAAELDGITYLKELWYIVIPSIYSVIVTYVLVGISAVFNNQMSLYSFGGINVPQENQTFGYYLYREIKRNSTTTAEWPRLAAFGLVFTFCIAPITFFAKWLLKKLGPKDY